MKENLNIDGLFRDGLNDYAEPVPASVWERVENDVQKAGKKPLIPMFLKLAAAIALLVGISSITYIFTLKDKNDTPLELSEETILPTKDVKARSTNELARAKGKEYKQALNSTGAKYSTTRTEISPSEESTIILAQRNDPGSQDFLQKAEPLDFLLPNDVSEKFELKIDIPSDAVYSDFILHQNILAQQAQSEVAREYNNVWSVGGQAGPQYSYRDASINPSASEQFTDYDSFEEGVVSFAGGVNVEVQAKKRWSFQSGVHYSKIGLETSNIVIEQNRSFSPSVGVIELDNQFFASTVADEAVEIPTSVGNISYGRKVLNTSPDVQNAVETNFVSGPINVEQNFEFIEVPLVVKYRLIDKKFGVNVSGGLWTNFLVGNSATATDDQGYYQEGPTNNINTINYIGSLGLGFNYPVSPKLLLSLDPLFKYYLSPLNNDNETEAHPYSFGLMTGLSYYF